jgi:hypothetical protein
MRNDSLTPVEEEGIRQALESLDAGHGLSFDDVMRELELPLVEDDLTEAERVALEEGMADIRAGRVVSQDKVLETITQLRQQQGE